MCKVINLVFHGFLGFLIGIGENIILIKVPI